MIGIIANPSSGKDIRRLVSQGTVVDNMEKVNIIQRILSVIYVAGLNDVYIMPDSFHMCEFAKRNLKRSLNIESSAKVLEMTYYNNQYDSIRAAKMLREMNASCIITLGGDGTNRAVAKECGDIPLIPISTGTNNVFPEMIEGTMVGMTAVVIEKDKSKSLVKVDRHKQINIYKNGVFTDIALIDVAITRDRFVGARALYTPTSLTELMVTVAKPDCLGMSAIAGSVYPVNRLQKFGLYVEIGIDSDLQTWVPIAPGMMKRIGFKGFRKVNPSERVEIKTDEGMIAVDGEREIFFGETDKVELELTLEGPNVVEVHETLRRASKEGFFVEGSDSINKLKDCKFASN